MKTVILRHRRENLKKCSLRGLEQRSDLTFYTYPTSQIPDYSGYVLLTMEGPPLTENDASNGLFIIDGTWRLASIMEKQIPSKLTKRSLPLGFKTAYPRRQTECPDPETGLATVEALYIAHKILKLPHEDLLDHYYWKELFLQKNKPALDRL